MFIEVTLFQYIALITSTVILAKWILLYAFYNNRFSNEIKAIQNNEYPLCDIFFIGFGILKIINFNINSSHATKRTEMFSSIKGYTYAKFYYYVFVGAKATYILSLCIPAFLISALANNIAILFVFIAGIISIILYMDYDLYYSNIKRKDRIKNELPNILSKLALLINTGMTLRNAWKIVSESSTGILYSEMKIVNEEIKNGLNDKDALKRFSDRCNVKEVRKFSSMLIQNLQKGNSETSIMLKELSYEGYIQKKMDVKIKGEIASQKLLLPMGIMLTAVLLIIIVPIFSSL